MMVCRRRSSRFQTVMTPAPPPAAIRGTPVPEHQMDSSCKLIHLLKCMLALPQSRTGCHAHCQPPSASCHPNSPGRSGPLKNRGISGCWKWSCGLPSWHSPRDEQSRGQKGSQTCKTVHAPGTQAGACSLPVLNEMAVQGCCAAASAVGRLLKAVSSWAAPAPAALANDVTSSSYLRFSSTARLHDAYTWVQYVKSPQSPTTIIASLVS